MTRRSLFAALIAPFVALKCLAQRTTLGTYTGPSVTVKVRREPEILSSWTDPVTGDLVVLAWFPGSPQPKDPNMVAVTEVRFKKG